MLNNDMNESSSAFFFNGDITLRKDEIKINTNNIFNDASNYRSVNEEPQANLASVNKTDKSRNEGLHCSDIYDSVHKKTESIHPENEETLIVSKFFNTQKSNEIVECDCIIGNLNLDNIDCQDAVQISLEDDREFRVSQLDTCDESLPIPKFFNITPREIPISPHKVIEEEFKSNPWAMLVATIFLTKTTAKVAKPIMKQFFTEFPSPYDVISVSPWEIEFFFETLGLRKRAHMIWRMSHQFISAKWRRASDLCGIGKYGEDAYRLFCLGHTDVEPTDRYLRLYLDWLKSQTDHIEYLSCIDSEDLIFDPTMKYYEISIK